jgi:3-oxosteroid 1-dehydrogenase
VRAASEPFVEECDVIVLGTGAAGLTAAISAHEHGAEVAVFEKSDQLGGTSAWSGGMLWIPDNPHMRAAGIPDSTAEALEYLDSLSLGMIDGELARVLIETGPEMVSFLEERTPVQFRLVPRFPDYHPEHPGGKPGGGRSLECPLYPFDELGEWASRVTVGTQLTGRLSMSETPLGRGAPDGVPRAELERRAVRDERGAGLALVGRLLRACLDRGIEPRTSMRATELVVVDGAVRGVRFDATEGAVGARGGVVLATGGFEWDDALVRSFVRGPLTHPVSVPTNTGDGLRMAMRVGVALGNMREAWWLPVVDIADRAGQPMRWQVNGERARPHSIMVNRQGRRFVNEAANYNALGAAFHEIDVTTFEYANLPCWIVVDEQFVRKFGFVGYRGEGAPPSWLTRAESIEALSEQLGIPPRALRDTVERFSAMATDGADVDFGRGRSAHDTWWGDPALTGRIDATLGPVDTAPFYAIEVHPGALGTKGGPRTDVNGQVLDVDGVPLPGLYAAGNVMASVMGMTYGGAGGTLAPAMVFGYLGGRHAARAAARVVMAT